MAPDPGDPADEATEQPDADETEQPDAEETVEGKPNPAVPPVVVPRWIQLVVLPLALLGLWELARKSGSVLLILIVASLVALILQPDRRARAAPPSVAARPGDRGRVSGHAGDHRGHRRAAGEPDLEPGHEVRRRCAAHRQAGEPRPRQGPEVLQRPRHPHSHREAGPDRAADASEGRAQALRRHRLVLARPARQDRDDRLRPRARAGPVRVPASVRPADRRARAQDHAAGRRDARGRLPDAGPAGACRATSVVSSASA